MNRNILKDLKLFAAHLAQELENKPLLAVNELIKADHSAVWEAMDRWDMQRCKQIYTRKRTLKQYDGWALYR